MNAVAEDGKASSKLQSVIVASIFLLPPNAPVKVCWSDVVLIFDDM